MGLSGERRKYAVWAAVLAVAVAVVGAVLLRATFSATGDGGALPPVTVAVTVTWFVGGIAVLALGRHGRGEESGPGGTEAGRAGHGRPWALPDTLPAPLRRHPLTAALVVGVVFATTCVVGALVFARIPLTEHWVSSAVATARGDTLAVLAVAAMTGVAEEVYFRIGLRAVLPDAWYVLGSTAAYGLVTAATGNGALVVASVLLGLVAARMYVWFPRAYVPVVIHLIWTAGVIGIFPTLDG